LGAVWSSGETWFADWVIVSVAYFAGGISAKWALWAAFTFSLNPQLFVAWWLGTENGLAIIDWEAISAAGKISLVVDGSWWTVWLCASDSRAIWEWLAIWATISWSYDQLLVWSTCWTGTVDFAAVDDWFTDFAAFLGNNCESWWAIYEFWASEHAAVELLANWATRSWWSISSYTFDRWASNITSTNAYWTALSWEDCWLLASFTSDWLAVNGTASWWFDTLACLAAKGIEFVSVLAS